MSRRVFNASDPLLNLFSSFPSLKSTFQRYGLPSPPLLLRGEGHFKVNSGYLSNLQYYNLKYSDMYSEVERKTKEMQVQKKIEGEGPCKQIESVLKSLHSLVSSSPLNIEMESESDEKLKDIEKQKLMKKEKANGKFKVKKTKLGPSCVIDCTNIKNPSDLSRLACEVVKPIVQKLKPNSRIILIARTPGDRDKIYRKIIYEDHNNCVAEGIATGLSGFTRSLAKEVGGNGTTVNLIRICNSLLSAIETSTDANSLLFSSISWPLLFFLLPDSAYITGQEVTISQSNAIEMKSLLPPLPLTGKIALVTGARQGIGAKVVERLAEEGAQVIGLDRPLTSDGVSGGADINVNDPLVQTMRSLKGTALLEDITSAGAEDRIRTWIENEYGGLDIVVHNAGITRDKTLKRMTSSMFSDVVNVNFEAIIRMNKAFGLPPFTSLPISDNTNSNKNTSSSNDSNHNTSSNNNNNKKEEDKQISKQNTCLINKGGRIILLSSINGIAGAFGQTNYAMSKSGLIGYCHSLSREFISSSPGTSSAFPTKSGISGVSGLDGRNSQSATTATNVTNNLHEKKALSLPPGITINCVAPGFIETEMTQSIPFLLRELGRRSNSFQQGGLPDDVAAAIAFLVRDGAGGVNGQTIRVCGGNITGR